MSQGGKEERERKAFALFEPAPSTRKASPASIESFVPPSDEAFEELAQLAATICGTSTAAIFVLDGLDIRQVASIGLPSAESVRLRPFYELSFVDPADVVVVEDAASDPRLALNLDIGVPPRLRFYLGIRLSKSDGCPLALLCVADRVPGKVTAGQRLSLEMLGHQVLGQLELRRTIERARRQAADLARAIERADASDLEKKTFLGSVSHDIRTPLNGVLGMANLLEGTSLTDRQRLYTETLRTSGEDLLRVIEQSLGASAPSEAEPYGHSVLRGDMSEPRTRRVLVVDDTEVNRIVLCGLLEDKGCIAECAASAEEALEMLRRESFDLVFMDVNMPGMDGIAATRELRSSEPSGDHLPVVAVTASTQPEDESRCRQAGMDGFIRKPINERVISAALDQFLG